MMTAKEYITQTEENKETGKLYDERSQMIIKSNELIKKSRYSLTTQQQKIVLYLISKIKPTDTEFQRYSISISHFCDLCGIEKSSTNYKSLKDNIQALRNKSFFFKDGKKDLLLSWIENVEIDYEKKVVSMRLDERLKPYLLELKENYTKYTLSSALLMKSKYSIRLYEYLKSMSTEELFEMTIANFRELLEVKDSYTRFSNLKVRVIDVAVRDINLYTDLKVDYQIIKTGKTPSHIVFYIHKDSDKEVYSLRHKNNAELEKMRKGEL